MIQYGGIMVAEKDIRKIMSTMLFCESDAKRTKEIFDTCACEVKTVADGTLLLSPQTTEKMAGLVLSGRAVVTTPDPNKKTLLRFLGANEPFGISNLFTDDPFVSIIRAHGECRVFFLTEAAMCKLLEEDHKFLYRYLAFLTGRIQYLNQKIGYLTAGSAERRLALYLASLGKNHVRLEASISALSELLDVGRASIYRAFDRLTEDGFLQKEGRNLTLTDVDAMLKAYR